MPAAKKLTNKHLGKGHSSEVEDGCELIASLKLKNVEKLSSLKEKKKLVSKSHVKAISSPLSKKVANKSSCTQSKKGRPKKSEKSTREALNKMLVKNPSTCKSPEKKSSPVHFEENAINAIEGVQVKKQRKKRKKKRRQNLGNLDVPSRLERRTRYLLIKMKLEQNLIDAYSGEGWKGHSREKIKPVKELQRAKKQILKCKLGIREAIRELDNLSSAGRIEDSVIAPDGSVYHEHIFCANCKRGEASPDNDIILCDGTCNRAFHQKCLDPPLDSESIPPEDQGWFCRLCECKIEILESMNAHLGTSFSLESNWQEIFKEEAAIADAGIEVLDPEDEWPSDDSADDDYNPERREGHHTTGGDGTENIVSDGTSSSTSLSWSLDGEELFGSRRSEQDVTSNPYSSDECTDADVLFGPRQRSAVDYKQLYHEMFGKDSAFAEQVSEDEDWGPSKRRRREKESDAASTLITLHESEKTCPRAVEENKKLPAESQSKRTIIRIPLDAVEKLRQVFAENELPSRSVRVKLSEELGLDPEKVSKWFKNARYLALKTRKAGKEVQNPDSSEANEEPVVEKPAKQQNADAMASTGTAPEASFHPLEDAKVGQQKGRSSSDNLMKKSKQKRKRHSLASSPNSNKVDVDLDENVCLKKQIKLLKAKSKKEKRKRVCCASTDQLQRTVVSTDGLEKPEAELERLCRLKNRLEDMRETLRRFPSRKSSKAKHGHGSGGESSVVYVPIAVVAEKNRA